MQRNLLSFPLLIPLALAACGDGTGETTETTGDEGVPYDEQLAREVIEGYATVVHQGYADARASASALETAIDELLATPSDETLSAARQAWLAARVPYAQTEVFRFYGGPIDVEPGGPEGQLNSWPMDEAYVDYVEGDADAGIINDPVGYPELSAAVLVDANGVGGETYIATGYHAIEFLLWGQDLSPDGPGARPHTDFDTGSAGTASNQDRRGEYLRVVTELLVSDLQGLTDTWTESGDYRATFTALDTHEALTNMLLGMGSLSGAELSGERMTVAFDTQDQEDEHSCFSDNTHMDILGNELGIQNVYLGRYGAIAGPGLSELVAPLDPELDKAMRDRLEAAVAAIEAIPPPFDQALIHHRDEVQAAIDALRAQTETIVDVATLLGITLNLEA